MAVRFLQVSVAVNSFGKPWPRAKCFPATRPAAGISAVQPAVQLAPEHRLDRPGSGSGTPVQRWTSSGASAPRSPARARPMAWISRLRHLPPHPLGARSGCAHTSTRTVLLPAASGAMGIRPCFGSAPARRARRCSRRRTRFGHARDRLGRGQASAARSRTDARSPQRIRAGDVAMMVMAEPVWGRSSFSQSTPVSTCR